MSYFMPFFFSWFVLTIVLLLIACLNRNPFFYFWASASALTTLLASSIPHLNLPVQTLIFSILTMIATLLWWFCTGKFQTAYQRFKTQLQHNSYHLIGRQFQLCSPIKNGIGYIVIDGRRWSIIGEDMPEGTIVTITGVRCLKLEIKRVE